VTKEACVDDACVIANYHECPAHIFRTFALNSEAPESKKGHPLHNKSANDPLMHAFGGDVPEEQAHNGTDQETQSDARYKKSIERNGRKDFLGDRFATDNA
jgi:hypothetical protein